MTQMRESFNLENRSWIFVTCVFCALGLQGSSLGKEHVERSDGNVTFTRDIAPIIFDHCRACHRAGQIAPFSLLTFNDVKKRAEQIALVTQSKFMPPWLPADGDELPELAGRRRLSVEQIDIIGRWVRAGAPEGEAADLPAVPEFAAGKWPLGKPDVILCLNEPFSLPAEGLDVIRTFVFRNDTMQDMFIEKIDVRSSNPQAIHHVSFLIDQTGNARMLDQADPGPGYATMADIGLNLAGSHGVWGLGFHLGAQRGASLLPRGVARPFPADSDLVAEAHFKPTGKPEQLDLEIGLYLKTEQITRFPVPITLGSFFIDIPPDEKAHTIRDSFVLPVDAQLLSIAPRAHYICTRMNVQAVLPTGNAMPLLRIDDWDFNWMQEYYYADPPCLPAGTRIEMEFVYDNTAENPRNPTVPPQRVRNGFRPIDEMGLLFLHVIPDQRGDQASLEQAKTQKMVELMEMSAIKRDSSGR